MISLLSLSLIFVAVLIIHIVFCSQNPDKRLHAKPFIILALCGWGLWLIFFVNSPIIISASLLYFLLIPCYLIFYVSTVLISPSKKILQVLVSKDASREQILEVLVRERFIQTRLEELIDSKCLILTGNKYKLTSSGMMIARVLNIYQRILGRGIGG